MVGVLIVMVGVVGLGLGPGVPEAAAGCPSDSVESGNICVDKYEASVWYIAPPLNFFEQLVIGKIKNGTVKLADLNAVGAVQLGLAAGDLATVANCPITGNGCVDVYAVSIRGVTPAAFITWFQAAAAARNSGKRLATNAEWQTAALGTPDTGGADDGATTCNTDDLAPGVTPTGSRSTCKSDVGAFDMVGNLWEWVADWVPRSTACPGWDGFSDDHMCLAGASETATGPGALIRGGHFFFGLGADAGVFAVDGRFSPSISDAGFGFRAAR
jgi:hypothetical protein